MAGGIEAIAASISADLVRRLPRQNKKQRLGLAQLIATMLDVRSANLMDLSASLPREAERIDMRYQWISRLLGNERIDTDWVMAPFASEVLARVAADGQTTVLIIDQTKANETQQAVVVAVRVGGRSLPIAWRVKETEGAIGFAEQKAALDVVLALLPEDAHVVLMGDRFYGSPDLIAWCARQGWDWRLRPKADLLVFEDGGESTLAQCFARGERMLTGIELTGKRIKTNVGPRRSRLRQRSTRMAIPSRGSSPCRKPRPQRGRSTTACVGVSRRCFPTSRAGASGSRTASCSAPTGWIA